MQTKTEFLIWDKIVNSAKKRFDYDEYAHHFSNPETYDQLILHIIVAFACGESHESIAINLRNELQHAGLAANENFVDRIVADKHIAFSSEIYAAYLTFSMLEDGNNEVEILGYVTDLLESPKVY